MDAGMYILDQNGNLERIEDGLAWGRWFENIDNRRIGYHEFESGVYVSTVFLGIYHWGGMIFETMVFEMPEDSSASDALENYTRRYKTLKEAAWGHSEVMAEVVRDGKHKEDGHV